MRRSGRVDPFLPVVPPQQTRQVIAQIQTFGHVASLSLKSDAMGHDLLGTARPRQELTNFGMRCVRSGQLA